MRSVFVPSLPAQVLTCSEMSYSFLAFFPAPLPMDAIERMAAFCMKDLDEEDGEEEDDLEDEDELMVIYHGNGLGCCAKGLVHWLMHLERALSENPCVGIDLFILPSLPGNHATEFCMELHCGYSHPGIPHCCPSLAIEASGLIPRYPLPPERGSLIFQAPFPVMLNLFRLKAPFYKLMTPLCRLEAPFR